MKINDGNCLHNLKFYKNVTTPKRDVVKGWGKGGGVWQ